MKKIKLISLLVCTMAASLSAQNPDISVNTTLGGSVQRGEWKNKAGQNEIVLGLKQSLTDGIHGTAVVSIDDQETKLAEAYVSFDDFFDTFIPSNPLPVKIGFVAGKKRLAIGSNAHYDYQRSFISRSIVESALVQPETEDQLVAEGLELSYDLPVQAVASKLAVGVYDNKETVDQFYKNRFLTVGLTNALQVGPGNASLGIKHLVGNLYSDSKNDQQVLTVVSAGYSFLLSGESSLNLSLDAYMLEAGQMKNNSSQVFTALYTVNTEYAAGIRYSNLKEFEYTIEDVKHKTDKVEPVLSLLGVRTITETSRLQLEATHQKDAYPSLALQYVVGFGKN